VEVTIEVEAAALPDQWYVVGRVPDDLEPQHEIDVAMRGGGKIRCRLTRITTRRDIAKGRQFLLELLR
jgi:hypothetical protein